MQRKLVSVIILAVFIAGCATLGFKSWVDRTPKEKALAMMSFYNTQYKDTFNLATNPSSTPAQKEMAMAKKAILKKLYPAIQAYDSIVVMGQIPSIDLENQILGYINQLGGAL